MEEETKNIRCGTCNHTVRSHDTSGKHQCTTPGCECQWFKYPSAPKVVAEEEGDIQGPITFNIINNPSSPLDPADIYTATKNQLGYVDGEIRTTSSTGAAKGVKPQRYDLIPVPALDLLAELYGNGAAKYAAHNWRRGYEWSKSYAAAMRHMTRFWEGEDIDPEMQVPHVICAAFHMFALATYLEEHPEFDDRFSTVIREEADLDGAVLESKEEKEINRVAGQIWEGLRCWPYSTMSWDEAKNLFENYPDSFKEMTPAYKDVLDSARAIVTSK